MLRFLQGSSAFSGYIRPITSLMFCRDHLEMLPYSIFKCCMSACFYFCPEWISYWESHIKWTGDENLQSFLQVITRYITADLHMNLWVKSAVQLLWLGTREHLRKCRVPSSRLIPSWWRSGAGACRHVTKLCCNFSESAPWVRALAPKPDNLRPIPGTHMVEEENDVQVISYLTHTHQGVCLWAHKQ